MKFAVAMLLALAAITASAQAYRWVDENGVVHYSDVPRDGAERIDLEVGETTTFRALAPPAAETESADSLATAVVPDAAPATTDYERLEVVRPQQGEMLWNIGAVTTIALRLAPNLAPNHRIYLIYDGVRRTGLPTDSLDIRMEEVYRGEHTIQAQIEDVDGNIIKQSNVVRFYVQQTVLRR